MLTVNVANTSCDQLSDPCGTCSECYSEQHGRDFVQRNQCHSYNACYEPAGGNDYDVRSDNDYDEAEAPSVSVCAPFEIQVRF